MAKPRGGGGRGGTIGQQRVAGATRAQAVRRAQALGRAGGVVQRRPQI